MGKADLATERKKQIIESTIECISRYGYNNFSMQDVARIAGVSKGIIHYYFLNKEELMMAVLDRVAGDIEALLTHATRQTNDPLERLKIIINHMFSLAIEKKEYYCINMDFWTQINQKEEVRRAVAAHYAKFRTAIAAIIQNGMDTGVFIGDDASFKASLVMALVDGMSLQWLFSEDVFDYNEMRKKCEELVLNSLLKKPGEA